MANFKSNSFSNLFKLGRKKRSHEDRLKEEDSDNHSTSDGSSTTTTNTTTNAASRPHSITSFIDLQSILSNASDRKKKRRKLNKSDKNIEEDNDEEGSENDEENEEDTSLDEDEELKLLEKKKEQELFLKNEKIYDELIDEKYRKYRPKGYKFNTPKESDDKPIRIYADGIFDLFHIGHMKQLEQCKKAFKNVELVVGVPSDKVTHSLKGLTVLTDEQRCESLKHCKWVDEVIPDCPWIVTPDFLNKHRIDYVAHDDLPYVSAGIDDIYKPVKELGKFLVTQRTDGISTSDIITIIIRDYDKYLIRNFARGATRQELNVSWLKQNELNIKQLIANLMKKRRDFTKKFDRRRRNSSTDKSLDKAQDGEEGEDEEEEEEETSTSSSQDEYEEAEQTPVADEPLNSSAKTGPHEFAKKFTGDL